MGGPVLFDPAVVVLDGGDRLAVRAAVAEFGPITTADVAATTGVELVDTRRALQVLVAEGQVRRSDEGWMATGPSPRARRAVYRQGGTLSVAGPEPLDRPPRP